jgi:hypothetical protein
LSKFDYKAKLFVKAAQWTGENLEDMKELLKDVVSKDFDGEPCVYSDYIEPFFYSNLINNPGYNMLKTEDDEFDPGTWVVVYDDIEYEGIDDEEFNRLYEKA